MRPLVAGLSFLMLSTALASAQGVPLPAPNPWASASSGIAPALPEVSATPALRADAFAAPQTTGSITSLVGPSAGGSSGSISADAPAMKQAIALLDKGQLSAAREIRGRLRDRASVTLFDWLTIRSASRQIGFSNIAAFLRDNPDWPARTLATRRAEEALYLEDIDAGTVRAFLGNRMPDSGMGQLALARISPRPQAAQLVKSVWRSEDLSPDIEKKVLSEFGGLLNADDHAARAEYFFFQREVGAAQRNASRASAAYQAIAKARTAVLRKTKDVDAALAAVPSSARKHPGYQYAMIDRLLRQDKHKEAAQVMTQVTRDPAALVDTKAWWEKRRWLARDMLDLGDARMAYRIAAGHANTRPADVADGEFHAGWIALRFLNDPATARKHFAQVSRVGSTPLTRSRGDYWLGRTEEASGNRAAAQSYYASASAYGSTYYGQLAKARLGGGAVPVQTVKPSTSARASFERTSIAKAIRLLYSVDAKEKTIPLFADTAERLRDADSLALLAELADRNRDPRGLLIVGKAGVSNGFPLEAASWPTNGVPKFKPVGPAIEPAVVHAIARQESAFHPTARSGAGARGLLQMLPETAKRTAGKVGMPFDTAKLNDPTFNATLGAAHLGELANNYDGSYILTFVAYNAGPGRVREWVQRYGDPRNASVDPIDWVERIPFTETRNYVQRVMENVQVYRSRFNVRAPQNIEADLRRGRG
ncbi:lytic transglycosylase domain-containing protein [Terrihabitans sp. B22-R8]|uniref:lytic transglycosylase domain-containing protein n=1 Tax=Terrihabitans sp. B22-R8 TaxID=3425128 RepID=UPI00403C9FCA